MVRKCHHSLVSNQKRFDMTPAELVIQKFGGVRSLARKLDIDHSSVARWPKPKAERGSNGLIPSQYHTRLLDMALHEGIELTAHDLIYGRR